MLTLAAFAVHTVLGCCWHHEHRTSDGGCQHPGDHASIECGEQAVRVSTPALHRGTCHDHAHAVHPPPSGQDLPLRDGAPVDETHAIDFAAACSCAASDEHSHQCDGTHCTYVRSDDASMPPAATQPLNWLAEWGNRQGQAVEAGPQAGNRGVLPAAVPFYAAAQACAVLQIWQI